MSTGPHRVRIEFVGITDMLLRNESVAPFYALAKAIGARIAEVGTGADAFHDAGYGGSIEMSCADADACYASIEDLLLASPLCEGATAVLIYGDEDDAEDNTFPVGSAAP